MNKSQILQVYKDFRNHLLKKNLIDAFNCLHLILGEINNQYFNVQFDKHKDAYKNILNYSLLAGNDPKKEEILSKLYKEVLELGDRAKENALTKVATSIVYQTKWQIANDSKTKYEESIGKIEEKIVSTDISNLLEGIGVGEVDVAESILSPVDMDKIFEYYWLSDELSKDDMSLLQNIIASDKLEYYNKSIIVSALTLSLLRCFDSKKLEILVELYKNQQTQVWQRAFIGIVFTLYIYNSRIHLYPQVDKVIERLKTSVDISQHLKDVYIQLLKTKETETISKQWEEEIMPEVMKMRPKLEDKLDLDNIISDKFTEDENPDWSSFFEDSPDLLDKLASFSQMQMEGSDVFMGTFARLKNYPFFSNISNWFVPFYKDNEEIKFLLAKKDNDVDLTPFIKNLESSFFMCNSDKYSFCINMQFMPESQKSMMSNLYEQELKSMNEVSGEDHMLQPEIKDKNIYAQYIQDLYRFFKVYPHRADIRDIFKFKLDIHNSKFFKQIVEDNKFVRGIAEFHFKKMHFAEAIDIFKQVYAKSEDDAEIIEKIGYAYQKQKQYEEALSFYLKAELLETNKMWLIKKIAFCYRKLENYDKALEYYLLAEKLKSEDAYILANIGHSYLQIKDYENALKYYFKVEFLSPENEKIQRPIAWCSFVLGKFEPANRYLDKLLKKEENKYDLMNKAHVLWCTGDVQNAMVYYKKCITANEGDMNSFTTAYESDRQFMEKHGIKSIDLSLMLDALRQVL